MNAEAEDEFRRFVHARSRALLGTAYALTGNQHSAEDLLQGALAKTAARWRSVHTSPEAYVRRVMYHDQVSRWRRRQVTEDATSPLPEVSAGADLADEASLRLAQRTVGKQTAVHRPGFVAQVGESGADQILELCRHGPTSSGSR
ncbi:MAG: SigE family RNA polymerase sigma factor, partial [Actinobacteria bacterium]|nr:SigE family RNA polymerase sigma factor [Actinomycetota bacterium]